MDSRYPGTRARTSTDSTATKRPTYSSWSATILLTGLAIVTCGGGGGEACGCDWLCPQAASAGRSRIVSRRAVLSVGISVVMKLITWVQVARPDHRESPWETSQ